jgi:3-methylcrotonyl-CoA carboxylase alpha subunit
MEFQGQPQTVRLTAVHDGDVLLRVATDEAVLRYKVLSNGAIDVAWGSQRSACHVYKKGDVAHVFTAKGATQIVAIDALAHAGDGVLEGGRLTAPMPGKVVSFSVKAGDKVHKGQALAVMEAMKMEHTIAAPADGVVGELLFSPGDQVTEGSELLRMEVAA